MKVKSFEAVLNEEGKKVKKIIVMLVLSICMSFSACGSIEKEPEIFTGDPKELLVEIEEDFQADEYILEDGYAAMILKNADENEFDYYYTSFRDNHGLEQPEFRNELHIRYEMLPEDDHYLNQYHWEEMTDSSVTYRFIRYYDTAAVFAGSELPDIVKCFQMIGAPDSVLAAPLPESGVIGFIPECQTFDLEYADIEGSDDGSNRLFEMKGITMEQVEELIAAADEKGFVEVERSDSNGENILYYHGVMPLWDVELFVASMDGKLAVMLDDHFDLPSQESMLNIASNYDGNANGQKSEEMPKDTTEILLAEIDLEQAQQETIDGNTTYILENISYDAAMEYMEQLEAKGWIPNTRPLDNYSCIHYYLEEYEKGEITRIIVGSSKKVIIMDTTDSRAYSEEELYAMVGANVQAGELYIRSQMPGCDMYVLGAGMGYDMAPGVLYYYYIYGTKEMYDNYVTELTGDGFVEDVTEIQEDGYYEFSAWRADEYAGSAIKMYTKVILEGEYLEVQMGKTDEVGSHKE